MNLNCIGFNNGTITLDEPLDTYYSGQVLSGKVTFELNEPLKYSAIKVSYTGSANVEWTEQQIETYSGVKRYNEIPYKAYEEYFNIVQCISGGMGTEIVLPGGHHSLPFAFQIPYNVPSSFSGDKGNITYKITVSLELPPTFLQQLTKTFEVIDPLDLNQDTTGNVKRPIEIEFDEFYTCCCSSKPVTIKVKLPVSGFCPGQAMPITIDAHNSSSTEISKIIFQLVTREKYRSRTPVSEYIMPEKLLATVKKGPIMAKTKREYQYDVLVPDIIAPNLANCNIIDLTYCLKVTIKLSGCNDDYHDESEIYIGMIPLDITTGGSVYVHPMSHSLPRAPVPVAPNINTFTNSLNNINTFTNSLNNINTFTNSLNNINTFTNSLNNINTFTNSLNNINNPSYSSNNDITMIPLSDGRISPNPLNPIPSAPYPEENPKPYEIGFKM